MFLVVKKIVSCDTLPTVEILSGKNAQAWVSMVSYIKKMKKLRY